MLNESATFDSIFFCLKIYPHYFFLNKKTKQKKACKKLQKYKTECKLSSYNYL